MSSGPGLKLESAWIRDAARGKLKPLKLFTYKKYMHPLDNMNIFQNFI